MDREMFWFIVCIIHNQEKYWSLQALLKRKGAFVERGNQR